MWWAELDAQAGRLGRGESGVSVDPSAEVHVSAMLDASNGPVRIGARSKVCAGAYIQGPAEIGEDCMVGNMAMLRGPLTLGDEVRIGFATELKNAIVEDGVLIGPQCFVADSKLCRGAYLGAQVRTSNERLDRQPVEVLVDGVRVRLERDKLGCLIGEGAALGIQVIVLPGREVAPNAQFAPRMTVEKNLPSGRYRLAQHVEAY